MKKILILANAASGLYNFRAELVQELLKDYEVYFSVPELANDIKVKKLLELGAKHIYTPMERRMVNPIKEFKLIFNYIKLVRKINPDIVLTYTIKPNVYGALGASIFKKPVLINVTGIGSSLYSGKLKHIVKLLYKYGCSKAKKVFFQNDSNRSFFINENLVNEGKTILLPGSGVNINKFKPVDKEINLDKLVFLFIGRVMKEKGIEEFIQAGDIVSNKYGNVEFGVVGFYEEDKYHNIFDNSKVSYLGMSYDVRNEIKNVDCIVNPSYHEGMSNVLLEGGAMGKPLIASNIPGCYEIIDDTENGYLFEVKSVESLVEKIEAFVNLSVTVRIQMGLKSREKVVKEFNRDIVIKKYRDIISELI